MAKFKIGDLVVLKSGSMRMCVEAAEEDAVACVWCNEGVIGRDRFAPALLNAWEYREDHGHRGADRGGDRDRDDRRPGSGKPYSGQREGGGKPHRGRGDDNNGPPRKTGWDGKPRDKKYFRKDD
ncbi:MAG: hypothetical protein AAF713_05070 [Pseudomonadota bacterium]